MLFYERLKELRNEKKITQTELSKLTNLSTGCIGMLETGKREPTGKTLVILADFFGCSVDYLIGREDDFGIIQPITAEEYEQGARYTKKINVTATEEILLDKIKDVLAKVGEDGLNLVIDFCDVILKN